MPSTRAAENDARRGTALLGSLLSSGESSDVIQHVLTQLLDSAKCSGGFGDRGKCPITKEYASPHSQLQTLVLTLSRVCSTWDDAVCTLLHGGAAICLQPRELRVMKCKAHAIDLTGMHDEFVRELEEKLGGQTVSVPSGYDEEDDDMKLKQLPFLQTLYDDVFSGKKRFLRAVDAEYKKFLVVKAVETLVRDRVDALAFGSTGESLTEMESEAVTPKKPTSAIQFMVASRTYAVGDETVKRFVEDWNALSDADRASFAELAKRDKERYTAECTAASPHSFIEELAKPLNPKEANELGLLGKSPFVVRCQPTRILDLMWHVHMTFPRKYSTACTDLIGAVIDHNPGYRNPEGEGSSKLVAKLDAVYATERKWKNYPYDLGWMISNRTIQDFCWQLEESYAEAFFGEPGCG